MLARASVARCDGRNCRTPASNRWLRPCTIDHHRRAETSQTARDPDPALWRLRLVSDGRIIEVIFGASSRPQSVIAAGPFAHTEGRFLAGATTKMAGGSAFWMKGLAALLACESVASANLRGGLVGGRNAAGHCRAPQVVRFELFSSPASLEHWPHAVVAFPRTSKGRTSDEARFDRGLERFGDDRRRVGGECTSQYQPQH